MLPVAVYWGDHGRRWPRGTRRWRFWGQGRVAVGIIGMGHVCRGFNWREAVRDRVTLTSLCNRSLMMNQ